MIRFLMWLSSILSLTGAIILAHEEKNGWGWLLIICFLSSYSAVCKEQRGRKKLLKKQVISDLVSAAKGICSQKTAGNSITGITDLQVQVNRAERLFKIQTENISAP